MKNYLSRAFALVGLLALSIGLSGCYDGYSDASYGGYGYTGGVAVYGTGYYAPGWGGCCYGPAGGVPMGVSYGYGYRY